MQQRLAILLSAASLVITAACSQSDSGITTAVKAKLAADDTVKASEINVDTHNRVVTLNGTVETQAEKDKATMIARDTNGVASVVDDIVVGPVATTGEKAEEYGRDAKEKAEDYGREAKENAESAADKTGEVITDAAITSAVKTQFLAEPGVSGLAIDVDTTDGVVTLNGTVKARAEADKAMAVARDTKGVKRVVSHLKVG